MKKFLSISLVVLMVFGACFMTACKANDEEENKYAHLENFDSYVPKGSDIIGVWKMTAPTDDMEWQFFKDTTLHQTKIQGTSRTSTVCTYNYDGEGNLKVYALSADKESAFTVVLEGNKLTLTDTEGVKYTFEKK